MQDHRAANHKIRVIATADEASSSLHDIKDDINSIVVLYMSDNNINRNFVRALQSLRDAQQGTF